MKSTTNESEDAGTQHFALSAPSLNMQKFEVFSTFSELHASVPLECQKASVFIGHCHHLMLGSCNCCAVI